MAGYVYKGAEPWTPHPDGVIEKALPTPSGKKSLKPCGTTAAYARHIFHDEIPCAPCQEARHTYQAEQRAKSPKKPRKIAPCGTLAAWARHYRRKEPIDEDCRIARVEYSATRYQAKKAATQ